MSNQLKFLTKLNLIIVTYVAQILCFDGMLDKVHVFD